MSNYTTNDEPTETKPTNVIKKLRNDNGADQINAEALKYGGLSAIKWIQRVVFLRLTKLREP